MKFRRTLETHLSQACIECIDFYEIGTSADETKVAVTSLTSSRKYRRSVLHFGNAWVMKLPIEKQRQNIIQYITWTRHTNQIRYVINYELQNSYVRCLHPLLYQPEIPFLPTLLREWIIAWALIKQYWFQKKALHMDLFYVVLLSSKQDKLLLNLLSDVVGDGFQW